MKTEDIEFKTVWLFHLLTKEPKCETENFFHTFIVSSFKRKEKLNFHFSNSTHFDFFIEEIKIPHTLKILKYVKPLPEVKEKEQLKKDEKVVNGKLF